MRKLLKKKKMDTKEKYKKGKKELPDDHEARKKERIK